MVSHHQSQSDLILTRKEDPLLEHLFNDLDRHVRLASYHIDAIISIPFHTLDYALVAAYELCADEKRDQLAFNVAALFSRTGAGYFVLQQHLARGTAAALVITNAVGTPLHPDELNAAIRLSALSCPPNHCALAQFAKHNAVLLDAKQVRSIVAILTSCPDIPTHDTLDAVYQILRIQNSIDDAAALCRHWISDGTFDICEKCSLCPSDLIMLLCDPDHRDIQQLEGIATEIVSRVRWLVRSKDRRHVHAATDYVFAVANAQAPWLRSVTREYELVCGSAEWDGWAERDEMSCFVRSHLQALREGKSREEAWDDFTRHWSIEQRLKLALRATGKGNDTE